MALSSRTLRTAASSAVLVAMALAFLSLPLSAGAVKSALSDVAASELANTDLRDHDIINRVDVVGDGCDNAEGNSSSVVMTKANAPTNISSDSSVSANVSVASHASHSSLVLKQASSSKRTDSEANSSKAQAHVATSGDIQGNMMCITCWTFRWDDGEKWMQSGTSMSGMMSAQFEPTVGQYSEQPCKDPNAATISWSPDHAQVVADNGNIKNTCIKLHSRCTKNTKHEGGFIFGKDWWWPKSIVKCLTGEDDTPVDEKVQSGSVKAHCSTGAFNEGPSTAAAIKFQGSAVCSDGGGQAGESAEEAEAEAAPMCCSCWNYKYSEGEKWVVQPNADSGIFRKNYHAVPCSPGSNPCYKPDAAIIAWTPQMKPGQDQDKQCEALFDRCQKTTEVPNDGRFTSNWWWPSRTVSCIKGEEGHTPEDEHTDEGSVRAFCSSSAWQHQVSDYIGSYTKESRTCTGAKAAATVTKLEELQAAAAPPPAVLEARSAARRSRLSRAFLVASAAGALLFAK